MDITSIKFNYIDDWKNEAKINVIKDLIISGSINNRKTLLSIIGNQSKKTYKNGDIIDDKSLTLKKFFDVSYREKSSEFYVKLDEFKLKLINNGFNKELINNSIYEIIKLIQANTVCSKYNEKQLLEYKTKIIDILETRNKEDELFKLFNQLYFENLVNEPNHDALKYLLDNGWSETKKKYIWLTELITFINNGSLECKEYLISIFNLKPIENSDISSKKLLIKLVAQRTYLNKFRIYEIIDFVFSIGNYYKHGTYYKWYSKELEYIELFEKYKNEHQTIQSLEYHLKLNLEYFDELTILINEYQTIIDKYFNL